MYRPLPHDPEGYSMAPDSRVIHTRYAKHVPGLRKARTLEAVYHLIGEYAEPVPCDTCYPAPEQPKPKSTSRKRSEPVNVMLRISPEVAAMPETREHLGELVAESITLGPTDDPDPEPED